MKKTVYLDNNATTQTAAEVVEEMSPFFHDLYGNPSSMHSFGGQVHRNVEQARERVAALLGAQPDEVSLQAEQPLGDGENLKLLVEKDFRCLSPREGEDDADLFPNPGV